MISRVIDATDHQPPLPVAERRVMTAPRWLDVIPDAIPTRLRGRDQWVAWRATRRDGRWTKVPTQIAYPTRSASVDDPGTWGRFDDAVDAQSCAELRLHGIGYVLAVDDQLVGLDLDKCRNPETGGIESWALAIVEQLRSYTEVSPSGAGVRIFVHGALPPGARRRGRIEMYSSGRYLTLTGHRLAGELR